MAKYQLRITSWIKITSWVLKILKFWDEKNIVKVLNKRSFLSQHPPSVSSIIAKLQGLINLAFILCFTLFLLSKGVKLTFYYISAEIYSLPALRMKIVFSLWEEILFVIQYLLGRKFCKIFLVRKFWYSFLTFSLIRSVILECSRIKIVSAH